MATEFLMPKLGLTMEAGTIIEWLADDGDAISAGDAVLRIETDKVESDVEAVADGLLHRLGEVGETYDCGVLIGYLLEAGEEPPSAVPAVMPEEAGTTLAPVGVHVASGPGPVRAARILASPNARRVAAERGIDIRTILGSGPGGRIVARDVEEGRLRQQTPPASGPAAPDGWPAALLPATAAARQLADLLGLDLATIPRDPTDGRVTRESVAQHVRALLHRAAGAPDPERLPDPPPDSPQQSRPSASTHSGDSAGLIAATPLAQEPAETVTMTGMRGTIASRMHASLHEMAQLTLSMDADMSAVVTDRERRKSDGTPPGLTDYVIAAVARALAEHPMANSQVTADGIAVLPDVHVGMAVAVDDGLLVPAVRNTRTLDLASLSAETTRLALAARNGELTLQEMEGSTFSVTALGMYGVDGFTPVINPPNAAILGVGRLRDDVVVTDGSVSTVKRLTLSLTWDHRVLDGAPAAAFCQTIVRLLGRPDLLDATG